MTDHIIDIAAEDCRLNVRNGLLVIQRDGCAENTVPLAEIAVLCLAHPRVVLSHSVLSGMAENGGMVIACDKRHTPAAMLLPLDGNHVQAERFAHQAQAGKPLQKRLWQQIIRKKIETQAALLVKLHGADAGIGNLMSRVRSGDPANVEAQASRRYWKALFQNKQFRRKREEEDQNRHLNYGYAALRAVVARAVCAAGLHPSLGLHHHNRYNGFCLADDLMEPFRPMVDETVVNWIGAHDPRGSFNRETREALLGSIAGRVVIAGESRTIFDAMAHVAASLVAVYAKQRKRLLLPETIV